MQFQLEIDDLSATVIGCIARRTYFRTLNTLRPAITSLEIHFGLISATILLEDVAHYLDR